MEYKVITNTPLETMEMGEKLAHVLPSGITLLMTGDLGAGKTTFVRGLAKGLEIKDVVQSPTFNIMKIYLKAKRPLIHIDAYRLSDIDTDIGLDEYIGYETGITVIEWPVYIKKLIPDFSIEVKIENKGEDSREFTFIGEEELVNLVK